MSSSVSRFVRPLLRRNNFRCTKLCRPARALFSGTPSSSVKSPVKAGQKSMVNVASKIPPIRQAPKPPLQPEHPLLSNTKTVENLQKQNLARVLYDSGDTLLYQAPSHAGFLTATFLTGTMCFIGAVATLSTDLWRSSEVPWWINTANQMGVVCFTFLGGWIVLRATRHITGIKLVHNDNRVKMLVTVRRMIPIPFVPPKQIITNPIDFVLPSHMVAQVSIPAWLDKQGQEITGNLASRILKRISRIIWTYFAGMRKVFTHEGFLDVEIHGTKGFWKLDTAGKFANGGRNLFDIVSYASYTLVKHAVRSKRRS